MSLITDTHLVIDTNTNTNTNTNTDTRNHTTETITLFTDNCCIENTVSNNTNIAFTNSDTRNVSITNGNCIIGTSSGTSLISNDSVYIDCLSSNGCWGTSGISIRSFNDIGLISSNECWGERVDRKLDESENQIKNNIEQISQQSQQVNIQSDLIHNLEQITHNQTIEITELKTQLNAIIQKFQTLETYLIELKSYQDHQKTLILGSEFMKLLQTNNIIN